jgi:hypothetical protein
MKDDVSNYSENDLLESMLTEPDDDSGVSKPTSIRTGIALTELEKASPRQDVRRPNATRWMYNPYAVIDLRNKPASCGMQFLPNVVFQKVQSFSTRVAPVSHDSIAAVAVTSDTGAALMGDGLSTDGYDKQARTSYMIARELEEHYGDKGVVVIEEITGEDDDNTAAQLNALLFGESVRCVEDPNFGDDFPVPVLPLLLETLDANVRQNINDLDPDTKAIVKGVATRVRNAIGMAMRNCRALIDVAQQRLLDDKNPNRTLSPAEQRCYLALGEDIPNQLPFLGKSMAAAVNRGGGAIDSEALGRGIAQGLAKAGVGAGSIPETAQKAVETIPSIPVSVPTMTHPGSSDFEVTSDDIEQVETGPSSVRKKGK